MASIAFAILRRKTTYREIPVPRAFFLLENVAYRGSANDSATVVLGGFEELILRRSLLPAPKQPADDREIERIP